MLAMTKSATVFVNYLAIQYVPSLQLETTFPGLNTLDGRLMGFFHSANEHTQRAGRKTIAPQDVLQALEDLEFPEFRPRLEAELSS